MAYKKGDEKKYFTAILAALIALAVIVGTFVYTNLKTEPTDLEHATIDIEDDNGTVLVNPAGVDGPSGPPSVPFPDSPPPSN